MEINILKDLWEMKDENYKNFHSKLIPNVAPERIIGIRTPALRGYAKKLLRVAKTDGSVAYAIESFMADLPHTYYDENNLHGFFIEGIKDFDGCIAALNHFLPYVDNWATCDMVSPKVLKNDFTRLDFYINEWLSSGHTYTVRYGIGMLMRYFLDGQFDLSYLDLVAGQCCEEYYVNMMVAWYFATALARQYEAALPYIEQKKLPAWTHNKSIQKAVESNRITPEQKAYLRTLKYSTICDTMKERKTQRAKY